MAEGMIFLPDDSDIELSGGVGIVSAATGLESLTGRKEAAVPDEAAWRGMITLCLLADIWPHAPQITVKTIQPQASAFASAVLAEPVALILADGKLLGLLDAGLGILPAAQQEVLDWQAAWYQQGFADPVGSLNEHERSVLLRRLGLLNQGGESLVQRLMAALNQTGLKAAQTVAHQDPEAMENLVLRMKAILGGIPGVAEEKLRFSSGSNPLLKALELTERGDAAYTPVSVWSYQGTPFARTNSAIAFEGANHPAEAEVLEALAKEIALMERYSTAWRHGLCQQLMRFEVEHHDDRLLLPVVKELTTSMQQQFAAPIMPETLRLTWPWKTGGSQQLLWREALGEKVDEGLAAPFADKLCLVSGGAWSVLGDTVLNRLCALPGEDDQPACAVIPPLSMALAACAGEQLVMESFAFRRMENGGVLASFALQGRELVVLERLYQPEEIRVLAVEESPTVAVWPSLPLEGWRAYYVYIHGGTLRASALQGQSWLPTEDRLFSVLKTDGFPGMIALHEGGSCLGVLPNMLPPCRPPRTETALGLMDIGASSIALALCQQGRTEPVRIAGLVRTLLRGAKAAPLSEEFLPALPLGPVLPAAVELFNDKAEPLPLVDGHLLLPEDCGMLAQRDAKAMHCAWKWSVDAASRRGRRLMIHQAMLIAALAAALKGAAGMAWRLALPESMAADGRRELWQEVTELAPLVASECGLPLADTVVSHADESMALGAYLRGEGGVRGGMMALDVGSGDVSMALWLRGMNRPAVRCSLPLGVQSLLLDGLLQAPDALIEDFAGLMDEPTRQSIRHLAAQLRGASGRKGVEKCRFLLDQCLSEHGQVLSQHMTMCLMQGRTTFTQSLILQGFAVMLTLSGLVQEQVWRDPLLNDHLPGEMTYVFAGRGGQLLTAMQEQLKAALAQFIRLEMSADHPVRSMRFQPAPMPKCETVLGLAQVAEVHTASPVDPQSLRASGGLPMPPDLLIMRFLAAFRGVFPQASQMLYGYVFDENGMITGAAENAIRACTARHFAAGMAPEAALAACLAELRTFRNE